MSGFYKGISGISLFVTIRLLMDYLGQDNYGLWVLVFTLFQLVLLMDFGLQSTLKTKIPLLVIENKKDVLTSYIKTTYKLSIYIALFIFILFLFFVFFIDLKKLFNIHFQTRQFVNLLFLINIFFFCISFVANIHKSLYVAFLKGKYAEESIAVNQVGITFFIAICTIAIPDIDVKTKLIIITFINGLFTFFVNLHYTVKIFKSEKINFSNTNALERSYFVEILKLGTKYMIIQLGLVFIFSSDQYIISYSFSPSEVSVYEVVNKLFQFPLMIFIAALSPLWSLFTKDYLEKEKDKILYSFKKFNRSVFIIICFLIIITLLCPFIVDIWLKNTIIIPNYFIILTAIMVFFRIISTYYAYFLNGIGQLNFYIATILFGIILKLPLSFYFISLGYQLNSVLIASIIILLIWTVLIPYKCYRLVNNLK